jgi:hypothetical protein
MLKSNGKRKARTSFTVSAITSKWTDEKVLQE